MKILYFGLLLLLSNNLFAQDTIIFKSGQILPVRIFSVDESAQLIGYINGEDTVFRAISSLSKYNLHSIISKDETIIPGTAEPTYYRSIKPSGPFQNPAKYTYSKYSFGVNLLSPLSGYGRSTIATNLTVSMYGEYTHSEKFGLRIPLRIGFDQFDEKIEPQFTYYSYNDYNKELLYEVGIEPMLYSNSKNKAVFLFFPGLYVGQNQGVLYSQYYTEEVDEFGYVHQTNNFSFIEPSESQMYYRIGLNCGIQLNISRTIQLGFDCGIYYGNISQRSYNTYVRTPTNPVYLKKYSYQYINNSLGVQGAVNLIYRFGGERR